MFEIRQYMNYFDYLSSLKPDKFLDISKKRQAKIMCNIGPASRPICILEQLMEKGMNIARIMLGAGNYEYDKETIRNIKTAAQNYGKKLGREYPFAIAVDLMGSEIKTGIIESGLPHVVLKEGDEVVVTTDEHFKEHCNADYVYVDYPNLAKVLKVGNEIYLSKGVILLEVIKVRDVLLKCKVKKGGKYTARDAVHLPAVVVDLPDLTDRDIRDIEFAVDQKCDMIIVSHTRFPETILKIKDMLGEERENIAILAKIENFEGIQAFDKLSAVADGICIGRNDLGIDITIQKLIFFQKQMTAKCNRIGKPVVVCAHILNSMMQKQKPRRDEVTDVANCIIDGVDTLMVDKQTTTGKYPLETLDSLAMIIKTAERYIWRARIFSDFCNINVPPLKGDEALAMTAVECANRIEAKAILVVTRSGRSAALVSKFRPDCIIFAISRNVQKAKHLLLYKGVEPIIPPKPETKIWLKDLEDQLQYTIKIGLGAGLIRIHDSLVILTPSKAGDGFSTSLRIFELKRNFGSILY